MIHIYNADFEYQGEVDVFESLMWVRRWSKAGDFQIVLNAHTFGIEKLVEGHILTIGPDKTGIIAHIEEDTSESGKASDQILVRGLDLKGLIGKRITIPPVGLSHDALTGNAETIMKSYVDANTISTKPERIIPRLSIAPDQLRGPSFYYQTRHQPLPDELEKLSLASNLGWDVLFTGKGYIFDTPSGNDLSILQSVNSPVIFGVEFDNVGEQKIITSNLDYRNVAIVAGQGEGADREIVVIGDASGLDRNEVFIDARDIEDGANLPDRGRQKLAEYTKVDSFETDILTDGPFEYKKDWDLGDIVTIQNAKKTRTVHERIVEVTEIHEKGSGFQLRVVFGNALPTLIEKIKRELDEPEFNDGRDGVPGPTGETGPRGPQGLQGIKGDTGERGLQGLKGDIGLTGATGPQGERGFKGDTGLQGPKGDIGPAGPKGDTGLQGVKGATGSTGLKGDAGYTPVKGIDYFDGATGPKGDAGARGPQGLKGDTGATGAKGDTGLTGPAGIQGERGPQGLQGQQGEAGYTPVKGVDYFDGLQGPNGDIGPRGLQGIQGIKGDTGPIGPKGDQGIMGPPGSSQSYVLFEKNFISSANQTDFTWLDGWNFPVGIRAVSLFVNGKRQPQDAFTEKADGKGVTVQPGIDAGQYVLIVAQMAVVDLQGPRGAQGVQGIKGEKGDKGDQGIQGVKGATGATGLTGPAGPKGEAFKYTDFTAQQLEGLKGPQGLQGVKGATGSQGLKGDKGDTGPIGLTGLKGDIGAQGPQGLKGDAGLTGATGPVGPKGDTGLTGATGPKGDQGIQGERGNPFVYTDFTAPQLASLKGEKGDTGAKGATGATGPIGLTGAKGDQGIQGVKGEKGDPFVYTDFTATQLAGLKGEKGDTGATGAKGDTGPRGLQGIQGIQGIKGDAGAIGLTGPKGDKGDTGAQGPPGAAVADSVEWLNVLGKPTVFPPSAHSHSIANVTGLQSSLDSKMNSVSVGSTADPNITQESYILTNHANSPGGGVYWHILTYFYSVRTGNRAQTAVTYNGNVPRFMIRHIYGTTWTPWAELETVTGAQKKVDDYKPVHIGATPPANKNLVWYDTN
ncbi:Gp37-like protein [Sporosarcina sp. SAFN-010]|uniref:Gp37-like protein n=1 Tax=Sporosarcina sp. SAFN-010 TaxID=3387273 RepID=UPI003F805F92